MDLHPLIERFGYMAAYVAAGLAVRRTHILNEDRTRMLSRLVVDFLYPCLVFRQLLVSMGPENAMDVLRIGIFGLLMLAFSYLSAYLLTRVSGVKDARTFRFCTLMPNWIFLPLAIIEPTMGEKGVFILILLNVTMQLFLWTGGLHILRGRLEGAHPLRMLIRNPGLIASVAGLLLALLVQPNEWTSTPGRVVQTLLEGLRWIGMLTIPASLIALGSQLLGGMKPGIRVSRRGVAILAAGRLVLAPALFIPVLLSAFHAGVGLSGEEAWVLILVSTMPVAITCSLFVDRFGGDAALASRGVLVSTLASIVTVPLWMLLLFA